MEKVLNTFFTVWAVGLSIIATTAIIYGIVQVCLGNYHGTASFEF